MAQELILKVTGMDCDGCVKAVTRAATGAGTAPLSVDLKSGEMRLPEGADVPGSTLPPVRATSAVAPPAETPAERLLRHMRPGSLSLAALLCGSASV